ncbi:sirohydrochlorin chelatase [Knoellia sp. p5-6-4]|uniref:sirohydrochlorin chelatase n=1 Tax=unclassified Knoellia TaxID=2618719 RepID=UPI0023DBA3AB|nr:CbiX/SirB N-terminal domain-containing protein [Knoellia sp. p5-6-4]MDF2145717.1 CbiX/SirB N-terminal domain-containing protein [Knoellia sp. p5-6-4]
MSDVPDIVLLAHGSPDPRHRHGVDALAHRVREASPGRGVHTAYLDHHPPTPADAAARALSGVVVPVLLTPAYHARVDVPEAVAAMNASAGPFTVSPALGPHPLLLRAAAELLARAGTAADPGTAVVLYAAGSSDSAAVASIGETLRTHGAPGGWGPWRVAALDGGSALPEVLDELQGKARAVVAVAFMVAEGVLRDRMAERCAAAGVPLVPGALGDTAAAAALVLERADSLRA